MTTNGPWSTHTLEFRPDTVVKTFGAGAHDNHRREWTALTLLHRFAPDLAPRPVSRDPRPSCPVVVMSRLPGAALRGTSVRDERVDALATTLNTLYAAVPDEVVRELPVRPGQQDPIIARIDEWARWRLDTTPPVRRALAAGVHWLNRGGGRRALGRGRVPAVFGPGDGNLANYLEDPGACPDDAVRGTQARIRVVDFEESGRSDRAFELAEITEHVSSWVDTSLDVRRLLDRVDLTPAEAARVSDCRRLLALVWLFLLSMEDPRNLRNPPGTAERQAARLTELLG
ncbi:phosphotransferase family protein [Embleya sp. NPDC056575]|uniref:phosphotransferase family protein n=1 Tax=unclassified Embleya TaxID=2699296 RepID=UPI0036AB47E7